MAGPGSVVITLLYGNPSSILIKRQKQKQGLTKNRYSLTENLTNQINLFIIQPYLNFSLPFLKHITTSKLLRKNVILNKYTP